MKTYKLSIKGVVQGVYYRQSTQQKAMELGIKGTAKNCDDGSVEVFAEGDEENLNQFIKWCHEGPRDAKVERIDIHEESLKNYKEFSIIH